MTSISAWAHDPERLEKARALGFDPEALRPAPEDPSAVLRGARQSDLGEVLAEGVGEGTCLVSVVTISHLAYARTMIASALRQHPEIDVRLVLADWREGEDETPPEGPPGVTLVSPWSAGFPWLGALALEHSPMAFCAALKPFALHDAFATGRYRKLLFLDSDLRVYARLDALLQALDEHDLVVTPHLLAPFPHPERHHEIPDLAHVAASGPINSGLLGLAATSGGARFLEQFESMVAAPGGLLSIDGELAEQVAFNFAPSFLDRVHVLRDPAYNVAYWNLHDRSLRFEGEDPETGEPRWSVDGRPLVAYHFSGLDLDRPQHLSRWDHRNTLQNLPSVARLVEQWVDELYAHGVEAGRRRGYGFATFASGVPIDARMRRLYRRYRIDLWRDVDPFTSEGERHWARALLRPVTTAKSLLPLLVREIYEERADVRSAFPDGHLDPEPVIRWFLAHGATELGYQELIARHRPTLPTPEGLDRVAAGALDAAPPDAAPPDAAPFDPEAELWDRGSVALARRLWSTRADLRDAFPDPFAADARRFAEWLATHGVEHHLLPAAVGERFATASEDRALSRIFTFVDRDPGFARRFPLALVGVEADAFARELLGYLAFRGGSELDLDDVEMYLWTMEHAPQRGLPLCLELAVNRARRPSSLLPEGQEELLAPVLGDPRLRVALDAYRHRFDTPHHRREAFWLYRRQRPPGVLDDRPHPLDRGEEMENPAGVNVFGYFASPVGIGHLSRGLGRALRHVGAEVSEIVGGLMAMDPALGPDRLVRPYRFDFPTNVFVTYPHFPQRVERLQPEWAIEGRRNVAYLTWELRDVHPWWRDLYADFDQVWALSSFIADAFADAFDREVLAVPGPVDFAAFPDPVTKAEVGLPADRKAFLYVFDAGSSIERKNPEAAVDAFARAFSPDDDVLLLFKISNGGRLEHRRRLLELVDRARRTGLDIRFRFADLPHVDLLRLVSAVDGYVSLHRAEGLGYTCAEAMAYAKPVIASRWSGNLEFMDDRNSLLVECAQRPIEVPEGPFQRGATWAEPDLEHAAAQMRRVYEGAGEIAEIGRRAAEDVRARLGLERVAAIVGDALGLGDQST